MATVIIERTSEYLNRLRNYGVYIDGEKVGTIANGETKEFTVSQGTHTIVTKIDWCSSTTIQFSISDDETKAFKVSGFKNAHWLMPAAIIIIISSYLVNLKFGFDYSLYLTVPIFLLLLYYITVGRKRYLMLIEAKTAQ